MICTFHESAKPGDRMWWPSKLKSTGCNRKLGSYIPAGLIRLVLKSLHHTQLHTPGGTPVNEWSARRGSRYLHNTRQMHGFALSWIRNRNTSIETATGIGTVSQLLRLSSTKLDTTAPHCISARHFKQNNNLLRRGTAHSGRKFTNFLKQPPLSTFGI